MKLNTALAVILSFAFTPVANAVYKCKDTDGKTVFSDVKCAPDAKTISNTTSVIDASGVRQNVESDKRKALQDRQREEENARRSAAANAGIGQTPPEFNPNVYHRYTVRRR